MIDELMVAWQTHIEDAGVLCGRGDIPDGAGWQGAPGQSAFVPYAVVWRIGSADQRSATIADGFDWIQPLLFVRTFGASAQQADQTMSTVRQATLGADIGLFGYETVRIWLENSQTTTKTEETEVPLYEAGDFYRWWLTPVNPFAETFLEVFG